MIDVDLQVSRGLQACTVRPLRRDVSASDTEYIEFHGTVSLCIQRQYLTCFQQLERHVIGVGNATGTFERAEAHGGQWQSILDVAAYCVNLILCKGE